MPKSVRKTLAEMDSLRGGAVTLVRKSLGVSAFGMQIFDFPEGVSTPIHDESPSGQEEVYFGLSGTGWVGVDGERVDIGPDVAVFVPPGVMRSTMAGPGGLRFLSIGATPQADHAPNPKFD